MSGSAPRNLLLVGGGVMGSGIAATFLAGGWNVQVTSPSQHTRESLLGRVKTALAQLESSTEAHGVLNVHSSLGEADVSAVDFVIEAVAEDLSLKQAIFRELEAKIPPDIPLASNTSTFPISDIAHCLDTAERVVGTHFFMPAHLVPLVEVVLGQASNPTIAKTVAEWLSVLGKRPIMVNKDIPGFIANRIQHAMMREALYLIEDGVSSPEDIDTAVRFGFGFRFIACGPILQKEMSGWDTNCRAGSAVYPHLCNKDCYPPSLQRMVGEGRVGMKSLDGLWHWNAESVAEETTRINRLLNAGLRLLKDDCA